MRSARTIKPENTVKHPDLRICEVLAGLAAKYGKTYCYPSQTKLCELLKRFTGRVMSRRTLNRHLNALQRDMMISRRARMQRAKNGSLIMRSTLYHVMLRYAQRIGRAMKAAMLWPKTLARSIASSGVPITAHNERLTL